MNSYGMEPYNNNDENLADQDYKQDLGFKKQLYKYQHENEQLKNQIKALTEKLESIMAEKSANSSINKKKKMNKNVLMTNEQSTQQKLQKYWSEQLTFFYKRIQQLNLQIKDHKQSIDQQKEQQYVKLADRVKANDKNLAKLRNKLNKFKNQQEHSPKKQAKNQQSKIQNNTQQQHERKLINDLQEAKRRVREMQRTRNLNQKKQRNKHLHIVDLEAKTRQLTAPRQSNRSPRQEIQRQGSPKKFGLWGLELTPQNYQMIHQQFEDLKKQKNSLIQSIKIENSHLQERLVDLKNRYIDLSTNNQIINNSSMELSRSKIISKKIRTSANKQKHQQSINLPEIPIPLGKSAYERKNDKNFVEKKPKSIQWLGGGRKGVAPGLGWNDQGCKSPITGINIWMDKYLMGIQFIHTFGQSNQHLHIVTQSSKKITPIQYRLNNNDYLENIILVIMTNPPKPDLLKDSIVGVQFHSKNGRKDIFGLKIGSVGTQKFDFNIKAPQKPIYSFGSFVISPQSNTSCVNKLGFIIV